MAILWCYVGRCSVMVNHKVRRTNFIAPCCSQAAQTCQNDNTSPPLTPGATSITSTEIYDARVPPTIVSNNISQTTSNISNILSTIGSSPFITTKVITGILLSTTAHVDCSATPTNMDSTSLSFIIMQLNCNGLRDKLLEILAFIQITNERNSHYNLQW